MNKATEGFLRFMAPGYMAQQDQKKMMQQWADEVKKEMEEAQRTQNMEKGQTQIYSAAGGTDEEGANQSPIPGVTSSYAQAGGSAGSELSGSNFLPSQPPIERRPLDNKVDLSTDPLAPNALKPQTVTRWAEADDMPLPKNTPYSFAPNPGPLLGDSLGSTPAWWMKSFMR
jgi:hypothetical protein